MKRRLLTSVSVALALLANGLDAFAINISTGSTITENFNSIGTAASTPAPTDWKVDQTASVRTLGAYSTAVTSTTLNAGNGMSGTAQGAIYNYGAGVAGSATDRAIGFLTSSTAGAIKTGNLYTKLLNNGVNEVTSLTISYSVEKYRTGSNAAGYQFQMYYSFDGTSWTSAGANFLTAFVADGATAGYTTAPGATVSVLSQNLTVSVPASATLYLCWSYSVSSGSTASSAQGLGIDDVSITANATVATAPTVTTQPTGRTNNAGTTATFSAFAGGTPTLLYQWQKGGTNLINGGNVSGVTTTNLTITSVLGADAGSYSLFVTNAAGGTNSSTATLTVVDPIISSSPVSQTRGPGGAVTFAVTAAGTSLSYTWQKGGTNLVDGGNVSGVSTTNLVLTSLSAGDAGNYQVIVSNVYGAVTSSVAILTIDNLTIVSQPTSVTNNYGTTANFSVTASGSGTLAYQWRKDSVNLVDGGQVSGATTTNLTLTGVVFTNGGSYTVVVTNDSSSTTSSAGVLTVVDPIITSQPTNLTVGAGTTATFTVSASGTAPLTYLWKKAGVNVSGSNISGETTATLTITNCAQADATNYFVVVSGAGSPVTSSTPALTVINPPTITTSPTSRTNNAGVTTTFNVVASGTGLTYQWQKTGTNISGATLSSLSLTNILAADAGNYVATVSNIGGSTNSAAAVLTVIDPVITSQPRDAAVQVGGTTNFSVVVSGTPTIGYQWKKNGSNLSDVGSVTGSTTATLTISGAALADNGTYSVVATNSAGSATSSSVALQVVTAQGEAILATGSYSQNFDTMGTGTNLPAGWLMSPPGAASPTFGAVNNSNIVTQVSSSGGPTTGGRYNWGTSTNSGDRAIGFMTSGSYASPSSIMSGFYNATGSNIVALTLSFDTERYRINSNTASNSFYLSTDGTNWTPYTVGDSGVFSTGSSAYFFGDGTVVSKSFTLSNLSITNNGRFYLRWNFVNTGSSSSQGLGLDNVVLSATLGNPPVITTDPLSQTVDPGTTVNFIVAATGTEPFSYQWRKAGSPLSNGGNISGATNATLTIGTIGINDAVSYDVVITNFVGSVTSSVATLTLTNGAAIVTQPVSQTNNPGATVIFSVTGSGAEPLVYQWRKDSVNLTNSGTVTGATSTNLTLNNITQSDAGGYSVVVTNDAGIAVSSTATLTVTIPPTITTQPVSQTVWQGTNVTFTVAASGTTPFTYQWYFATNPLSNQTNATLSLTGVTTNQSGSYYVSVTGPAGTTNSATATLTVTPPISATIAYLRTLVDNVNWVPTDTTNIFQVEGTVTTHTNISSAADASFYIQDATAGINVFYTGGGAFRPQAGDNVRIIGKLTHFNGLLEIALTASNPTHGASILSTNNALPTAQYVALSSQANTALMESLEGSRVVISNVFIDLTAANFAINSTIKVTNANDLTETIDIRIDTRVTDFTGKAKPTYAVAIIGVLGQFDNSNPRDSGYQIIPTRFVDVLTPLPTITQQPVSSTNHVGDNVSFTVTATSPVALTYQWYFADNPLSNQTNATLSLTSVTTNQSGAYYVSITSVAGTTISATATLSVSKATPVITWENPSSIAYGTALSDTQLNATAAFGATPVSGTFTYTIAGSLPASGAVLRPGASQVLTVNFVPNNTTNYNTPEAKTATITVTAKSLTVSATCLNKLNDGPTSGTQTQGDDSV
ncbi:MAG: large protein, partial [Verrucomicrobiales bacterium]|nr:large protein [Verrucomicrobiales bacterium]